MARLNQRLYFCFHIFCHRQVIIYSLKMLHPRQEITRNEHTGLF